MKFNSNMDFFDLISAAEQSAIAIGNEPHQINLPCTNRNIFQTVVAAKDLSRDVHKQGLRSEQGKSMLLKNAGIDMDDVALRIGRIQDVKFDFTRTWEESDVSSHLNSTRENRILAEISYEVTGTFARSQQLAQKQLADSAAGQKSKMLNHFLREDNNESIFYRERHQENKLNPEASVTGRPLVAYADVTRSFACGHTFEQIYYDSILQCKETKRRTNSEPNYVKTFLRSVHKGPSSIQVRDLWNMVGSIDAFRPSGEKVQFTDRNAMAWVRPSIKFLEKGYLAYVFRVTQKNEPCSIPAVVYDVIKDHVKNVTRTDSSLTKFPNLVMIDDEVPIWAFLYYTIRSGQLSLIQDKIENNLLKCCTQSSILELFRQLRDYDRQNFIVNHSMNEIHPCRSDTTLGANEDPFHAILRSILNKTNLDHTCVRDIVSTCEDYLWLKLHQVVFVKTENLTAKELLKSNSNHLKSPTLHFDMFQYSIFEGAGYEQEGACNPMVRFMCLLLTCQYETALLYLHRDGAFRTHAVYLVIAMFKQGLIQSSKTSTIPKLRLPFAHIDDDSLIDITEYLNTPLNIPTLLEDYVWNSKFFKNSSIGHCVYKNFSNKSHGGSDLDSKFLNNYNIGHCEDKNSSNKPHGSSDLDSKLFQIHESHVNYDYEKCLVLFLSLQDIRSVDDRSEVHRSLDERSEVHRSVDDGSEDHRTVDERSFFEEKVAEFVLKYKCYEELFGKYQVNICELNQRLRLMRDDLSSFSHPLMSQDCWDDLTCICGFQHISSNKFGVEDVDDFESFLSEFKLCPVAFRDGMLFRLVDGDEEKFKEVVRAAADTARRCSMDDDAIQLSMICGDISIAIKLINRKLAHYFDKNPELEERKTSLKMASTIANLLPYYTQSDCCPSLIKAFRMLTLACNAYESYVKGSYEKAIRSIERMEVIPLDVNDLEEKHREFVCYDVCVKITIGTMVRILVEMYDHTLNTLAEASSLGLLDRSKALQVQWKQRISALVLFTSKDENWFYHDRTNKKLLKINIKLETFSF